MPPAAPSRASAPPAPSASPPPGRRRPDGGGSWGQPRRAPKLPVAPWTPCRGSTPPEYQPGPPSRAGSVPPQRRLSHAPYWRRSSCDRALRRHCARWPGEGPTEPRRRAALGALVPGCSHGSGRSSSGTVIIGLGTPADAAPKNSLADAAVDGVALGDGGVGDLVVEAERLKKGRGGGAGPKKSSPTPSAPSAPAGCPGRCRQPPSRPPGSPGPGQCAGGPPSSRSALAP